MNEEPNRARAKRAFGARSSIAAVMGLALACGALALTAPSASAEDAPAVESPASAAASPEASSSADAVASPDASPSEATSSEEPVKPEMTKGDLDVWGFARCHQVGGVNDGTWDITMTVKNDTKDKDVTASVNKTLINDDYADVTPPVVLGHDEEKVFTKNVPSILDRTIGARAIFSHEDDSRFMDSLGEWTYRELEVRDFACPAAKIAISCAAGLTVDLSGYVTRRDDDDNDRRGGTRVEIMIDDVAVELPDDGKVPSSGIFTYASGALNPAITHTANVMVDSSIESGNVNQTLSLSVCNPTIVPGPGTTTTVTVPGPTVSATATVTATPSPAVAPSETATPVITPAPATSPTAEPVVVTPEAATAPTAVNAGDGSSTQQSGLPLWALALAAVAAIGAAGASVRLATKKH